MATQFQGPHSDPRVLYKSFWQGPPQPMHEDDLILQACHYQPSHVQLKPSFPPCEYFPSPWKKRARWSEHCLIISCTLTQMRSHPKPSLFALGHALWLPPGSHLHSTGVAPMYTPRLLARLLEAGEHLEGPGSRRGQLSRRR